MNMGHAIAADPAQFPAQLPKTLLLEIQLVAQLNQYLPEKSGSARNATYPGCFGSLIVFLLDAFPGNALTGANTGS